MKTKDGVSESGRMCRIGVRNCGIKALCTIVFLKEISICGECGAERVLGVSVSRVRRHFCLVNWALNYVERNAVSRAVTRVRYADDYSWLYDVDQWRKKWKLHDPSFKTDGGDEQKLSDGRHPHNEAIQRETWSRTC